VPLSVENRKSSWCYYAKSARQKRIYETKRSGFCSGSYLL